MPLPIEVIVSLWLAAQPASSSSAPIGRVLPDARIASPAATASHVGPSSLLRLGDAELAAQIEADPGSIGSVSIGAPGSAVLFNAVSLEPGPGLTIAPGSDCWATSETIEAIETAIDTVQRLFPDTPNVAIGDISDRDGGRLKRHESHQGGRDVDFGFYYKPGKGMWFTVGTAATLDLPRNWALLRAIIARTDVDVIFVDTRIQRLLYQYALSIDEDRAWLDRVFQFSRGARDAIIQHLPNHRTHYHVRFYNPVAQELGRRAHPVLVQLKLMAPPVFTLAHLVRPGQTLGHLASRYGTSIRAIMQANGLATTQIRAGRVYRIPVRAAAPPPEPIVVPPRALPPVTPVILAGIDWPTSASQYGPLPDR